MSGNIIRLRRRGDITGFEVASGSTEHAHWPILPVQTGCKCCKIKSHDIPDGHTLVQDAGGGGGTTLHGKGASYRERLRIWIPCPDHKVELNEGSMMSHIRRLHGEETEIDWNWLLVSQNEHIL